MEEVLRKGVPLHFSEGRADPVALVLGRQDRCQRRAHRQAGLPAADARWRLSYASGTPGASGLQYALHQNFDSLSEALASVGHVELEAADAALERRWRTAVEFSFSLDLSQLPRPFQLGLFQPEWLEPGAAENATSARAHHARCRRGDARRPDRGRALSGASNDWRRTRCGSRAPGAGRSSWGCCSWSASRWCCCSCSRWRPTTGLLRGQLRAPGRDQRRCRAGAAARDRRARSSAGAAAAAARFGSQLMLKLAAIFSLVGFLPGLLIYAVSYQFVSRSIENWFDVRRDRAQRRPQPGRTTLETLVDLANKTRIAAAGLAGQQRCTGRRFRSSGCASSSRPVTSCSGARTARSSRARASHVSSSTRSGLARRRCAASGAMASLQHRRTGGAAGCQTASEGGNVAGGASMCWRWSPRGFGCRRSRATWSARRCRPLLVADALAVQVAHANTRSARWRATACAGCTSARSRWRCSWPCSAPCCWPCCSATSWCAPAGAGRRHARGRARRPGPSRRCPSRDELGGLTRDFAT